VVLGIEMERIDSSLSVLQMFWVVGHLVDSSALLRMESLAIPTNVTPLFVLGIHRMRIESQWDRAHSFPVLYICVESSKAGSSTSWKTLWLPSLYGRSSSRLCFGLLAIEIEQPLRLDTVIVSLKSLA